jgi:hypothetical protein
MINFTDITKGSSIVQSLLKWVGFRFDQVAFPVSLQAVANFTAVNASTMVVGTTWYIPMFLPVDTTISSVGLRVNTGGSAASVCAFSIVQARVQYPLLGKVMFQSGSQPCATSNADIVVAANVALKAGFYWLGFKTNSTTNVTLSGIPLTSTFPCTYYPANSSTEYVTRVSTTESYTPTFTDNANTTSWINGAGYTPFHFKFVLNTPLPNY